MRSVRILILACASAAAMAAMWLMQSAITSQANVPAQVVAAEPVKPVIEAPDVADVMVAARDISIGQTLAPEDVKWQKWPVDSLSDYFFVKSEDPDAIAGIEGAASRAAMRTGEPLSTEKIIDLNGSGVMAALLRKGMRAVSVPISDVTGAGGFILPGDYVDLMLTRQITIEELDPRTGEIDRTTAHNQTDTVLETVRVLAIDQRLGDSEDAGASAVGNTATIELTPAQTELIALTRQIAKQERGFMTLSLRSFAELVDQYGEDIDKIQPVTVLDLQAMARAKVERAKELRALSEEFRKEQELMAELERQRLAEEAELARAQAEADAEAARAAALAEAQATTVEATAALPAQPEEDDGIVLIRNGAPIVVRTVTDPNAGGRQ